MPRKRNTRRKNKLNAKQKKLLATRLIQISMKIDDYVYKNKVISVADAVTYVQEMATCKLVCGDDPRSLQVIEKITRCMNAIIAEQETTFGNHDGTTLNNCPSPVYSLSEADKTYFSQNSMSIANEETFNARDIETIDLCDDDVISVDVDVEIHRAMSNLSVKDNENLLEKAPECSQSILKDLDTNSSQNMASCFDKPIQNTISNSKTPIIHENVPKVAQVSNIRNQPIPQKNVITKRVVFENTDAKFQGSVTNLTDSQVASQKRGRKKTVDMNKEKKIRKKRNVKNQNKTVRRENKVDNQRKGSNISLENVSNVIDKVSSDIAKHKIETKVPLVKINARTTNANMHKKNQLSNSGLHNGIKTTNSISNSMVNIYNTCIENDLSWVENLRYVREIDSEEFDTNLTNLHDSFWDNFDLPDNWNERDFDY